MYPRGHELAHSRSMNWVQSAFITVARSFSLRERHATFWVTWPSRLQRYMLSLARSLSVHCIYTHTGGRAGRSCSSRMCACAPLASRPEPLGFMCRLTRRRTRAEREGKGGLGDVLPLPRCPMLCTHSDILQARSKASQKYKIWAVGCTILSMRMKTQIRRSP